MSETRNAPTDYAFDVSFHGTVPQAIRAFYDSTDFEDAIRTVVSLGGDCVPLTCITGGIAEAFYGEIPEIIQGKVYEKLDVKLGGLRGGLWSGILDSTNEAHDYVVDLGL